MNPVLQDFIRDLQRLERIFDLSQQLTSFPGTQIDANVIQEDAAREVIMNLHSYSKASHSDIPILNGVLLLYLSGRFENFVREIFEDLCDSLAGECTRFGNLPKPMQNNLILFTAEVIANPRKYGHAESGVISFVKTLADNLSGSGNSCVNSKCLSITNENMWPDTLEELFKRIGAKDVWKRIGQQARIQSFFEIDNPEKATSEAKRTLKELLELRNKIAHPAGGITWPSIEQSKKFLHFCKEIAEAITDLCILWSRTLLTREEQT